MEKSRIYFRAAGFVFAIFVSDILIAKVQVYTGSTIPVHLGDTLQFLVLLIAVALFVAGALERERQEGKNGEQTLLPEEDAPPSRGA